MIVASVISLVKHKPCRKKLVTENILEHAWVQAINTTWKRNQHLE